MTNSSYHEKDIIIRKKPPTAADLKSSQVLNAGLRSGTVDTEKRAHGHVNANAAKHAPHGAAAAKLEQETEDFRHKHVPPEVRQRIIKLRGEKKMTQAQLAQAINVAPRVVQEYENGKAIQDGALLAKMARALGVQSLKKP